jgi:hypothetical protein
MMLDAQTYIVYSRRLHDARVSQSQISLFCIRNPPSLLISRRGSLGPGVRVD